MPDRDEQIHYSDDDLFNPETQHESTDVNLRALAWFGIVFVVFSVVTWLAILGFYKSLVGVEARRPTEALTQLPRPADAGVPRGQPLLQPFPRAAEGTAVEPYRDTPRTDLRELRRGEKEALESYGWVDQQKGIVRIPIEEAKRIVVQRGLPVRQAEGAPR